MANPETKEVSDVIDDANMRIEMHNDLRDNYGMTNTQAKLFINEHGESIVSSMWDEYSFRMAQIIESNGLGN